MNDFEKDVPMAVSPMAYYFNSSVLSVFVLAILESEIPIDDSRVVQKVEEMLLPLNTRFSSIMIDGKKGKKQWKQVDVCFKEHVKIPMFPSNKSYDDHFEEYMSKIAAEQLPQDKPLWEMHIIKYPTGNAAGTFLFKFHHALGDGYTLMATLLSCVQSAYDSSKPVAFPSSRKSLESKTTRKSMLKSLPQTISSVFKGASDSMWSVLKGSLIADHQTPIRPEHGDLGFRPMAISSVSLTLDSIKEVKNKLKVSVNDAMVGIIFLGIRLYMESKNHESSKAQTTALVLLNTRKIRAYKPVKEMLASNSEAPWGNRFHFMHIPIPELNDTNSSNPLAFVLKANKIIDRKRYSWAVPLTGVLLRLLEKINGPEAAARYLYKTLKNSSLSISHMIGPVEKVALENHPIKGLYFMTVGLSQCLTVTITSYMGHIQVGFGVEKGLIDEHQLMSCFEAAKGDDSERSKEIMQLTLRRSIPY